MLADGTAAELYRRGGGWITLSAAPRLAWVRRHQPAVWAAASRLSLIADWMVFRLTGTLATEASIGSTSGLFDLARRAWYRELLMLCGLEPSWFPEVVEAGTVVGPVSGAAFSQTGLAPGTPVVAGGLDTALGLAGPRPAVPGQLTVTGGSFGSRPWWRPRPPWIPPAACARSAMSGRASGWSRGSASMPASRCAGSGTAPPRASRLAVRRATPSWRNWPRRYRPARAGSPPSGPGRCLDLGPLAAAVPAGAGCRPGRAGRAGPGYPGGRRLLHPPRGRAGQRTARSRRMAGGHPDRRGSPQQAVAADPRRRARAPGQRARAPRIGGPWCGDPRGPRGPGAARRSAGRSAAWPAAG